MGQIIFHCTFCGTKLSAELGEAGEEFECPQCQKTQIVPGGPSKTAAAQTAPGGPTPTEPPVARATESAPVIRIPKRKIVLSNSAAAAEREEEEEYYEVEDLGGTGLGLFAVALGTAGLILCGISMIWMYVSRQSGAENWWVSLIVFVATFLMGLMGLVLAQLARLVVRLADRVSQLGSEEE
ncbi:MAG: hypothetical protein JXB04_04760 [Kiritimatiellae bacterium]|nr:hypothetical protein [Kiritimatiellia bacterium]